MKQVVILSGKGGTGKTSVMAAFADLAHRIPLQTILVDSDVDAANLELVLSPRTLEEHDFVAGQVAWVEPDQCEGCGICERLCRFDAFVVTADRYSVDPVACDGCAACVHQCPTNAICMKPQLAGYWYRSISRYGPLFHAALLPAQENSGKLVTLIKQQSRLLAMDDGYPLIIVDGPPGIGCPVISAASGADLALIVAEPTIAGMHDMQRILQTVQHFQIPPIVCVNKADIFPEGTEQIEIWCREQNIELAGCIPFDAVVTEAMQHGKPVTAYRPESIVSTEIGFVWQKVMDSLSIYLPEKVL